MNCLGLGGTERQLVELLRSVDRSRFDSDLCVINQVGELVPVVRSLGFSPTSFHLKGTLFRPNTAVQVARLAKRIRDEHAALVHCHDFYSNLLGSAAARLAGVPYIVSRRDLGAWIGPARAEALKFATRFAPTVLCNAEAIRERIVDHEGVDASRVVVVRNGLDLERFDREAAQAIAPPLPMLDGEGPIVVVVGNMKHAVKGHAELLVAAHQVVRAVPECRFLLVGDGELRPELERAARTLGLGDAALFPGERADVPALLSRCAAAVSASTSEGLSNAVMEAMAAALPVVATRV
ncbi:MAG TPA: glycosyltransferase, partial [Rhizomicrobium sp.]|nr:glycosyltransferase [Rhizomicrobium sp.]